MTTIIISVLLALGIGGGVMVASSGGGGGSSGGAVVGPSNPGGSGGTSGGGTIVAPDPNLPAISPFIENALANPSAISIKTYGTITNNNINLGMIAYAPISLSEFYRQYFNYVDSYTYPGDDGTISILNLDAMPGNRLWWSGDPNLSYDSYIANHGKRPNVYVDFDLTNISDASNPYLDLYHAQHISREILLEGNKQAIWDFDSTLALGGRKLGLKYSDFGYYKWMGALTYISPQYYNRHPGGKQIYMYETSRMFTGQDRVNRYKDINYIATFSGNVIGTQRMEHSTNTTNVLVYDLTGDINLTLDFSGDYHRGALTGSITNVKVGNQSWYDLTISGGIKINSGADEFIKIYTVTYNPEQTPSVGINPLNGENVRYLTESNMFGNGAVIKGDTIDEDEVVGGLSFVGKKENLNFILTHLAFGAKKQPNN